MFPTTRVHVNDSLPDGVLTGYDDMGRAIVCIEFSPTHAFLFGTVEDEARVTEWHVCNAHARRISFVAAWHYSDYQCAGSA